MLRAMTEPQNTIAETPAPPYYAVVFTSVRTDVDEGYADMAAAMAELAARQPGYLGIESAREGLGITVSYWRDLDAIAAWKRVVDHVAAQRLGRERWYASYRVRVARVEREYGASPQARRREQVSSSIG
jgi:heme-degrading monooxygenase HmoA